MTQDRTEIAYIYVLFDPADGITRYVGQSINPHARLNGHVSGAYSQYKSGAVEFWISSMIECSRYPKYKIVEVVPRSEAFLHEYAWMRCLTGKGFELLNSPRHNRRAVKDVSDGVIASKLFKWHDPRLSLTLDVQRRGLSQRVLSASNEQLTMIAMILDQKERPSE